MGSGFIYNLWLRIPVEVDQTVGEIESDASALLCVRVCTQQFKCLVAKVRLMLLTVSQTKE